MILTYLHTKRHYVTEKYPFLFQKMIKIQKKAANTQYQQNLQYIYSNFLLFLNEHGHNYLGQLFSHIQHDLSFFYITKNSEFSISLIARRLTLNCQKRLSKNFLDSPRTRTYQKTITKIGKRGNFFFLNLDTPSYCTRENGRNKIYFLRRFVMGNLTSLIIRNPLELSCIV